MKKNVTNNKYQNKINDVKNEKIKKSLLELTKFLKKNEKTLNIYLFFINYKQLMLKKK